MPGRDAKGTVGEVRSASDQLCQGYLATWVTRMCYAVIETSGASHIPQSVSKRNLIQVAKAYTAHFDESGTHDKDNQVLTVSGFVSDIEKWKRFDREWSHTLVDAGLPEGTIFHMNRFARNDGVYAKFRDESRGKAELISRLIHCTRRNVHKAFSCTLLLRDWERINERYQLREAMGPPYPFCGLTCIAMVNQWARKNKIAHPVQFFFEDGARHKGILRTLAQEQNKVTPIFLPKTEMIQFQCCDLLAWKNRKAIDKTLRVGPSRNMDDLHSILSSQEEVNKIPNKYGIHHYQSLELMCRAASIPKRVP